MHGIKKVLRKFFPTHREADFRVSVSFAKRKPARMPQLTGRLQKLSNDIISWTAPATLTAVSVQP